MVGELVDDVYTLDVPDDLAPGVYRLPAGWYRSDSGERVSLDGGQDSTVLGEFVVP